MVIYLQPVNPPKEGQVSTIKKGKWTIGSCSLFLFLGTLLGLGMFGFVLFTILNKGSLNSDQDATTVTATTAVGPATMTTATNTSAMTSTEPTTMAIETTLKTTADITITTVATSIPSRQHL